MYASLGANFSRKAVSSFSVVCPFVGRRAPDRVACSGLLASKIRAASQTRVPDWCAFGIVRDPGSL